jgi:hypothetical protein
MMGMAAPLLILAHAGDDIARGLATSWGAGVRLIVPRDLSAPGWQHFPAGGGNDTIGIAGETVRAAEVAGVLVRIAAVAPADLPHIAIEDRAYVAGEMTAFLQSFLTSLHCPVINRPSPTSLMGPGWSRERWRAAAVAAGIEIIGAANSRIAERALSLARLAAVEFLPVRMTADGRFVEAEPWAAPPIAAGALRALLTPAVECAP